MIIDPNNANVDSLKLGAVEPWSYTAEGGIPWAKLCLKRVVEEYFRNEGESWTAGALNDVPLAAVAEERGSWMQSLHMTDDLEALDVLLDTVPHDEHQHLSMAAVEQAMREYQILKAHGLAQMSYEDYLIQAGVRTAKAEELHRPELIRYVREWTYPTNTVDPTNGTPRSAVSWAVAERADKARAFAEPGFIFGCTVARPKVYFRNQVGAAAGFMNSSAMWLPPMLSDDAWSSLTTHVTTSGSGPIPAIADAEGYTWDMRDLLLYGEQFINFDPSAATARSLVDLPASNASRDYVDQDDVTSIFVTSGTDKIRQDGVVSLTIKGRQRDTTPPQAFSGIPA